MIKINENQKKEDNKINSITFLMLKIFNIRRNYLLKYLKEFDIQIGEYPFLLFLYKNGPKSQIEITEMFNFTESNTAKFLRKLEDKQYIRKTIDEKNRRKKIVSLTDEGIKLCKELKEIENNFEEKLIQNISPEEEENLKEILNKIILEKYV